MKRKDPNLCWNVLIFDLNRNRIEEYNIFGQSFIDSLHKDVVKKKLVTNKEQLRMFIKNWTMNIYWGQTEWEMLVGDLFVKDIKDLKKISVYDEIKINLDRIVDYVNEELKIGL